MFANAFVRTLENEKDYSFDVKTKNANRRWYYESRESFPY